MDHTMWVLVAIIAASMSLSGVTMTALTVAYGRPGMARYRIREEPRRKLAGLAFHARVGLNGLFSALIIFGAALGLRAVLFTTEAAPWWRVALDVIGVLITYDFLYYLLHRYPFHRWGYLKRVHTIHHLARYPRAIDSLYLHPVENLLGLALIFACITGWALVVGPLSLASFAVIAVIYTQLNVIIHAGLDLPAPVAFLGAMARKHEVHHRSMKQGNYASITPLFDLLFGTRESEPPR